MNNKDSILHWWHSLENISKQQLIDEHLGYAKHWKLIKFDEIDILYHKVNITTNK